jgi:predicted Zn-dependent peptidase
LYEIIERVKKDTVDDATLQRVKVKLRAALIRKLDNNGGLAAELCSYAVAYGDWRKLFTELEDYNRVTADDVQRVAATYLTGSARTVAYTYTPAEGGQK